MLAIAYLMLNRLFFLLVSNLTKVKSLTKGNKETAPFLEAKKCSN